MDKCLLLVSIIGLFSRTIGQSQLICPGHEASIECSTLPPVIWDGTAFTGQCSLNSIALQDLTADNVSDTFTCGVFTVTITSVQVIVDGSVTVTTVNSTLSFTATSSLNDQGIQCRTAGSGGNAVNIQLDIPDISVSNLSITQTSLMTLMVDLEVTDTRCVQEYFVEVSPVTGSGCSMRTANGPTSSFSVDGLSLCRCRYSAVGYVQASTGMEGGRTMLNVSVNLSGLQGVTIDSIDQISVLRWTQLPNTGDLADCITGYTLSWAGRELVVGLVTSVTAEQLNAAGFPYCQMLSITVTPETAVGPVMNRTTDVILQHPNFRRPEVSVFSAMQSDGTFNITISWQVISSTAVPIRRYGLILVGQGSCMPNMNATGESVTEPNRRRGQYTACVMFQRDGCTATNSDNHFALPMLLSNPRCDSVTENSFSVTVSLPDSSELNMGLTLSMYSSIIPNDDGPVEEPYPSSQQQYAVSFSGLRSGVEYGYDMRIVLSDNLNTTISMPATGTCTTSSCGRNCIIGICVGVFLLLLIVVATCLIIIVIYKKLKDASVKTKDTEKLTRDSSPPALYADPNTIERQVAPGSTDEYAMVDVKSKKKKAVKPTQPEALYQDPNKIEHETAPSGEMYAVVDKPRGSSKKKKEPDVVPPGTEGLTYADIDVAAASRGRPRQASQHQAQEPVGSVEYSDVKFKEDGSRL